MLGFTCLKATHVGPSSQVNLPIASVDGLPVGLGLIGPPGSDEDLLQLTEKLMDIFVPA
jgi:amidase